MQKCFQELIEERVAIKEPKSLLQIPLMQAEEAFLKAHGDFMVDVPFEEYHIPLPGWHVQTTFVPLVRTGADAQSLSNKGILVTKYASGETLANEQIDKPNLRLPWRFHFAAIASWANLLVRLKNDEKIIMDSNIGQDLFLLVDPLSKLLRITRVDCRPQKADDVSTFVRPRGGKWDMTYPRQSHLTQEEHTVYQVVDTLGTLYSKKNPMFSFLDSRVSFPKLRFQEGEIKDVQMLYENITSGIKRSNWNDSDVITGDRYKFKQLTGQSLE